MESRVEIVYAWYGDEHGSVEGEKLTGLGGMSRLVNAIIKTKEKYPDAIVIPLNGGDVLGATPYTSTFHGEVEMKLDQIAGVQAHALGNHDLHKGPKGLQKLVEWAGHPFLAANVDVKADEILRDCVRPYTIIESKGKRIAIVGALTPEVEKYPKEKKGEMVFKDTVTSLRETIRELKAQGIQHITLLSHLGYKLDQEIAAELLREGIDLVILGNHTHTVLGNLPKDKFGPSQGPNPTVVEAHGHKAFITAVPHHGQALGVFKVTYHSETARISSACPEFVVINEDVRKNKQAELLVKSYREQLDPTLLTTFAETEIPLSGIDGFVWAKWAEPLIRCEETPLGNLSADSLAFTGQKIAKAADLKPVDFALDHAGGIRADLAAGNITGEDVLKIHPFDHTVTVLELTGAQVKLAIEQGVYGEDAYRRGTFLIPSRALQYAYDMNAKRGCRVTSIKLNGEDINPAQTYRVAVNSFMTKMSVEGEDSVFKTVLAEYKSEIKHAARFHESKTLDRDGLRDFLTEKKIVSGDLDGRIQTRPVIGNEPLRGLAQSARYEEYLGPENLGDDVKIAPENKYRVAMALSRAATELEMRQEQETKASEQKETKSASPSLSMQQLMKNSMKEVVARVRKNPDEWKELKLHSLLFSSAPKATPAAPSASEPSPAPAVVVGKSDVRPL